ncbi:hypothetical protein [Spirosoma oryzicola]|uniref:hypothetical protein n=1 Tax=Spirosoma oryzicola TaxID=2898794 RepID=UPI001E4CEA87|nr:hypothetical protein [Spirosoma oryzicola]UHG93233.1 hypothetical protein LQ777_10110 [Spirosoma oryzicola]
MKKIALLLLLSIGFAQAQSVTDVASYTITKSGAGIKISGSQGLVKYYSAPTITGEPRILFPAVSAVIKITSASSVSEMPISYIKVVGSETASNTLSGVIDQISALIGSGTSGTVTPAPATFGATAPTSADYTTSQTITTTNVLKILIENVGTTAATFTYSGLSYTFVQGDQRVFDAVYDATSNKLIPIASLVINPSASAPIRVTRFLKQ